MANYRTELRQAKEFKALGVSDFRTKAAQQLRDRQLGCKSVSFLHQAIRYRGKANYREALFLGYGASPDTLLASYVDDLTTVLSCFVSMAGAFSAQRLASLCGMISSPMWTPGALFLQPHTRMDVKAHPRSASTYISKR